MSFLGLDLSGVPDRQLLPEGEAELRCTTAAKKPSKTTEGNEYLELILESCSNPVADPIFFRANIPNNSHEAKTALWFNRQLKEVHQAFGVELNGASSEDFVGRTAWALVTVAKDEGYGERNEVKKFTVRK